MNYFMRLLSYMHSRILFYAGCTAIEGFSVFLVFSSIGVVLKSIVSAASGEETVSVITLMLYLVGVGIFSCLAGFTGAGFARCENKAVRKIRREMISAYINMDEKLSENYPAEEIINRISTDVREASFLLSGNISGWVYEPFISGLLSLILLFAVNWSIALLTLALGTINLLVNGLFIKRITEMSTDNTADRSRISISMQEIVLGRYEVRSYDLAKRIEDKDGKILENIKERSFKLASLRNIRAVLFSFFSGGFTTVSLLCLGYILSMRNVIVFSDIMLALPLADQISQMLVSIGNFRYFISTRQGNMKRIFEVIDLPGEKQSEKITAPDVPSIEITGLSFSYDAIEILHSIDLKLERGKKYGIVGESGSGKSTMMKLLLGLYKPDKGRITAGPIDSSHGEWTSLFSYMPQNTLMLYGDVELNVTMGDKNGDVAESLEMASATFVYDLENDTGYQLGEDESGLSGGQLQRIALARCLYRKAPFLIMDEPVSGLDHDSVLSVKAAIDKIPSDVTVIAITHVLKLVEDFDEIIVINEGCIAEKGTHINLIKADGPYARLFKKQNREKTEC